MSYRTPATIQSLRKALVEDSVVRARQLKTLIRLVREDERQKTIVDLANVRDRAEQER